MMTDGMDTGRLTMEARKKLTLTGATEVVRAWTPAHWWWRVSSAACATQSRDGSGGSGFDPGGGLGAAAGVLPVRRCAGSRRGFSAPPGQEAPGSDPRIHLHGAVSFLAVRPLRHLPGGAAAGLVSGGDGGVCPVGAAFRLCGSGVLRQFLAFCGTSPKNQQKNFSQI